MKKWTLYTVAFFVAVVLGAAMFALILDIGSKIEE